MRHRTWDHPDHPRNYSDIALHAMESEEVTEIGEAEFQYALNVMPPIYVPGGFLICESTCDSPKGPVHSMFAQVGQRYYAKYVVRGVPLTYIKPHQIAHALPLDAEDAKRYEDAY